MMRQVDVAASIEIQPEWMLALRCRRTQRATLLQGQRDERSHPVLGHLRHCSSLMPRWKQQQRRMAPQDGFSNSHLLERTQRRRDERHSAPDTVDCSLSRHLRPNPSALEQALQMDSWARMHSAHGLIPMRTRTRTKTKKTSWFWMMQKKRRLHSR